MNMRAAVLRHPAPIQDRPLSIETVPIEEPKKGSALLKVLACGVCRTDLHIVEGELPHRLGVVVPGHQIVAEVVPSPDPAVVPGQRGQHDARRCERLPQDRSGNFPLAARADVSA